MLALLTCHIGALYPKVHSPAVADEYRHVLGIAAVYTVWVPKMPCSSPNGDETGVCELVNTYTLIGTWIIPALRE